MQCLRHGGRHGTGTDGGGRYLVSDIRRNIVIGVNRRFFYGWAVVGVTSLGIFTSGPGQSHTFSVFVEPISRDLDISSTEISGAYGIATLAAAFLLPKTGTLVDRFGPRRMLLITTATNEATAAIYAVIFGLNNAFNMTMFGYLWPRYFGRRHLGSIQGIGQMMGVVAASLGPIPVGLALDYFGTATPTLRLLALYPLAAGIVALLFLRPPRGVEGVAHLE